MVLRHGRFEHVVRVHVHVQVCSAVRAQDYAVDQLVQLVAFCAEAFHAHVLLKLFRKRRAEQLLKLCVDFC